MENMGQGKAIYSIDKKEGGKTEEMDTEHSKKWEEKKPSLLIAPPKRMKTRQMSLKKH